jgi:hypothetical protein
MQVQRVIGQVLGISVILQPFFTDDGVIYMGSMTGKVISLIVILFLDAR